MLCAYSDSVPGGPGAGDDAAGMAVILETLRAIKAGPPLDRDLIVLLTMVKKMASMARGCSLTSILGPRRSAS